MPKVASHERATQGVARAADGAAMPQKKFFRQRAHVNPLSMSATFDYPIAPERMDWGVFFPGYAAGGAGEPGAHAGLRAGRRVEVADVGCGFGGLLVGLAPVLPDTLCLGLEIRSKVTEYVRLRILALRNGLKDEDAVGAAEAATAAGSAAGGVASGSVASGSSSSAAGGATSDGSSALGGVASSSSSSSSSSSAAGGVASASASGGPRPYDNISVLKTNSMKFLSAYFHAGQLAKIFFCFPDPHFKKSNHRRRIVSTPLLAEYAHALRPGGRLYTITDVLDLHNWMAAHGDAHPCFERLPPAELAADACVGVMRTYTEEGRKVARAGGDKHVAVFVRLDAAAAAAKAARLSPGGFWVEPAVAYTWTPAPSQAKNFVNRDVKRAAALKAAAAGGEAVVVTGEAAAAAGEAAPPGVDAAGR